LLRHCSPVGFDRQHVDMRISWIYHPILFHGILNGTYNLP
jgi:hypothetical protein